MNTINVALIQQRIAADYQTNLEASLEQIADAARRGARLIVLCELHTSLYFCQEESARYFELAEDIPGPITDQLSEAAKRHQVTIVGSVFERRTRGLYHNTAVVLDQDGSLAGRYRKMHIPDGPGYHEKYYFTAGDLGFCPIQTSIGNLGVMVCWDQWFPEAARLMALGGADILIYPSAIGWDPADPDEEKQRQLQAWLTIQQSHAISNNLPVICTNRVGYEENCSGTGRGIDFWGQSFVTDAFGRITARGPCDSAQTVHVTIDLGETERSRQVWPYLRDRRIDAYSDLGKRFVDESADPRSERAKPGKESRKTGG